jgi:hypothetical protein
MGVDFGTRMKGISPVKVRKPPPVFVKKGSLLRESVWHMNFDNPIYPLSFLFVTFERIPLLNRHPASSIKNEQKT